MVRFLCVLLRCRDVHQQDVSLCGGRFNHWTTSGGLLPTVAGVAWSGDSRVQVLRACVLTRCFRLRTGRLSSKRKP